VSIVLKFSTNSSTNKSENPQIHKKFSWSWSPFSQTSLIFLHFIGFVKKPKCLLQDFVSVKQHMFPCHGSCWRSSRTQQILKACPWQNKWNNKLWLIAKRIHTALWSTWSTMSTFTKVYLYLHKIFHLVHFNVIDWFWIVNLQSKWMINIQMAAGMRSSSSVFSSSSNTIQSEIGPWNHRVV
jgi:hypothetical protein